MTEENRGPDIIYTQGFQLANGTRYLDYTERDEAIESEQTSLNLIFEETPSHVQSDPEVPEDYQGYLGYTDRKAATRMMTKAEGGGGDYPTFTDNAYEISETQHQELEHKLELAHKNNCLLWDGVISFSPEFLREAGLYDPQTDHVDQRKIKAAIKQAMPKLLAAEQLNRQETFWWGDIHLNTDHVHVHVAISQTENTRPYINGEPRGKFRVKSFERFKAAVHRELEPSRSRDQTLAIEQQIDNLRKTIPDHTVDLLKRQQALRQRLLIIYQALPGYSDKRKWRAKNNSVDFRLARDLTFELVDDVLTHELRDEYQEFQQLIKQQDQIARQKYGKKIADTIPQKDERFRQLVANRIFTYLRDLEANKKIKKKDLRLLMENLGVETNTKLLEAEKAQLAKLNPNSKEAIAIKKRIGYRKFYLRQANLNARIDELNERIGQLTKLTKNDELKDFFLTEYSTQRLLLKLQKQPGYVLRQTYTQAEHRKLQEQYLDLKSVQQLPINRITEEMGKQRKQNLNREMELIIKYADDPGVQIVLPTRFRGQKWTASQLKKYYQAMQRVLDLKLQIKRNNQRLATDEQQRRNVNGPLFQELKQTYHYLEHGSNGQYTLEKYHSIAKTKLRMFEQERKLKNRHRNGLAFFSVNRFLGNLKQSASQQNQALKRKLLDDDDLEREDEREEMLSEQRGMER